MNPTQSRRPSSQALPEIKEHLATSASTDAMVLTALSSTSVNVETTQGFLFQRECHASSVVFKATLSGSEITIPGKCWWAHKTKDGSLRAFQRERKIWKDPFLFSLWAKDGIRWCSHLSKRFYLHMNKCGKLNHRIDFIRT